MLPIETIRNNPETVEKQLNSKGETIAISEILNIDILRSQPQNITFCKICPPGGPK